MSYIKSLDGIRGIAILLVLMFHAGRCPFGWVGVQLFFVLSGFLITGILLDKERYENAIQYLKRFWWRRSLRIFPIYFLFLGTLGITWMAVSAPTGFDESWVYLITYTYNFVTITEEGHRSYNHTWSLCVEEQFYLTWPLIVWFSGERLFKSIITFMIVSGPILRLLTAIYGETLFESQETVSRVVYYASPYYFEAFGYGAALAVWPDQLKNSRLPLFWLSGLCFLIPGALNCLLTGTEIWTLGYPRMATEGGIHLWGYTAVNVASTLLLAAAMANQSKIISILENKWLVYIGSISYGLYLYHNAVFALLSHWIPVNEIRFGFDILVVLYLVTSITIASASYHLIERPILTLKDRKFN